MNLFQGVTQRVIRQLDKLSEGNGHSYVESNQVLLQCHVKYNNNIVYFEIPIRNYLFLASFEHNRAGWCHWQAPDVPFWGVKWLVENCSRWHVKFWWIKRKKMWRQIRTSWLFNFKVNHQGKTWELFCFFSQRCKNNIGSFGQDIWYFPRNSSAKLLHTLHAIWQSSLFTMSLYLISHAMTQALTPNPGSEVKCLASCSAYAPDTFSLLLCALLLP